MLLLLVLLGIEYQSMLQAALSSAWHVVCHWLLMQLSTATRSSLVLRRSASVSGNLWGYCAVNAADLVALNM